MRDLNDFLTRDGDHYGWTGSRSFGNPNAAPRINGAIAQLVQYERHHGPVTPGTRIAETCDYKHCLNPEHLTIAAGGTSPAPRVTTTPTSTPNGITEQLDRIERMLEQLVLYGPVSIDDMTEEAAPAPTDDRPRVTSLQRGNTYLCVACGTHIPWLQEPMNVRGLPHITPSTKPDCGAVDSIVWLESWD